MGKDMTCRILRHAQQLNVTTIEDDNKCAIILNDALQYGEYVDLKNT
jgi:hypothetical protein